MGCINADEGLCTQSAATYDSANIYLDVVGDVFFMNSARATYNFVQLVMKVWVFLPCSR
eukprot:SAG31_NODE_1590_length_7805_cov_3.417390_10_plen_59_part_00